MTEKLEVDCFEIDIEDLSNAQNYNVGAFRRSAARFYILGAVIENLTQESKKRFEEYQEKNNPCKGD